MSLTSRNAPCPCGSGRKYKPRRSCRDPILLWRDTPSGRREGLALSRQSCEKPACTCREMSLEVLAIDDDLIGIDASGDTISPP